MDGACRFGSNDLRFRTGRFENSRVDMGRGPQTLQTVRSKETGDFTLDGFSDGIALAPVEAIQHELIDLDLDAAAHSHPPISDSVRTRSIFAHSLRAARARCDIRTGSPASAARNAAFKATFRILPPARFSFASF